MTTSAGVASLLAEAEVRLAACGIGGPRLDAEVLLAHTLRIDRGRLAMMLAGGEGSGREGAPVEPDVAAEFRKLVRRRALNEPIAYITGHKEFWSLDLEVTPAVLIPRPETEELVYEALGRMPPAGSTAPRVIDAGTGSGAIAIAIAVERPDATVLGVDISGAALEVARRNAERHGVRARVHLVRGDLLEAIFGSFDMVVSNPPYVDTRERAALMPDVRGYEPPEALYGGEGGMAIIQRLVPQAGRLVAPGGWLLMELAASRPEETAAILRDDGRWSDISVRADFAGLPRVLSARRRPEGGRAR